MIRTFAFENSRAEFTPSEPPPHLSPLTCVAEISFAALVRFPTGADQWIVTFGPTSDQFYSFGLSGDKLAMRSNGVVSKATSYTVPRDSWLLVMYAKGSGTVKPKFYVWDYETEEATVIEGSVALEDSDSPVEPESWFFGANDYGDTERFLGEIAAHAFWEDMLGESDFLTGLVEVEYLTDWMTVEASVMRGLGYWDQYPADTVIDWSGAGSNNYSGINGNAIEDEEPPVPYQAPTVPVNVTPPTVESGPINVNYRLNVTTFGTWTGLPSQYDFIWERSEDEGETWTPVSRSSPEYTPSDEDEGFLVRVVVYAKNKYGKSAGTPVGPYGPVEPSVLENAPVNTVAPVLSGSPNVGSWLATTYGTWENADDFFTLWYVSETGDPGTWLLATAGGAEKILESIDLDLYVKALIHAVNELGGVASEWSNVLGPVEPQAEAAPLNTVAPVISGTPKVGETIEGSDGSWAGEPESYAYQWEKSFNGIVGWTPISGAEAKTLLLTEGLLGEYLRVVVKATNAFGTGEAGSNVVHVVGSGEGGGDSGVFMLIGGEVVEVERLMLLGGELVPV